jgi:hypothetical protein
LKTIEKINRKAIGNSLGNGKAISAQDSPLSPDRARARARMPSVPDRRAPPFGANLIALSPSLSLSLSRGTDLSAPLLSPTPAFPLSAPPTPLVSASLTSHPRSPRCGRAHTRAFSSHDRAPAPCSPTFPLPFVPSTQLSCSLSLTLPTRIENLRHHPPTSAACSVADVAPVPCPVPR